MKVRSAPAAQISPPSRTRPSQIRASCDACARCRWESGGAEERSARWRRRMCCESQARRQTKWLGQSRCACRCTRISQRLGRRAEKAARAERSSKRDLKPTNVSVGKMMPSPSRSKKETCCQLHRCFRMHPRRRSEDRAYLLKHGVVAARRAEVGVLLVDCHVRACDA